MASSPTVKPVQIRNQAAANALLERHRLCPGTFGVPLGRLEVIEGNRPIDSAHVDELRRNMEGRIDVNRAPCQTVFFPKAGAQMTLEQARELFSTLRETNKAAIEQDELGWLFEVFDVQTSGGQHRAKVLKAMNLETLLWPSECFFQTILDDAPARFELIHGKNGHGAALPTKVTFFLHELRRVLNEIIKPDGEEPVDPLTIGPTSEEFATCLRVLDGWTPQTSAADVAKTKAELVKLFITSERLSDLITELSCYGAWEAGIGSFGTLKDWNKYGGGDVTAAAMMISKTPFEILFAHAPSQCTRAVASRLNGCPIPTTLKDIEDLKKKLDGVLKEGEWLAVEKAAKASRKELSAAFIEYDSFASPSFVGSKFELDALTQQLFIPLAVSIDTEGKKSYKPGGGAKKNFLKPTTTVILNQLMKVSRGALSHQEAYSKVQSFVTAAVARRVEVLQRLEDQEKLQPLGEHPLQPGFTLVKLLEAMLPVVNGKVDLQGFLPHAAVPAPIAPSPPPMSPKATLPSSPPASKKNKGLVGDESYDEHEDEDEEEDEDEVENKNKHKKRNVDGDEDEDDARRTKNAKRRARIRKAIYYAVEEFPHPKQALDEEVKAQILHPEVVRAARKIVSQNIAVDLLETLKDIGLGANPDGATSRLCELIGKHAGSVLIDQVNLEALVTDNAELLLETIDDQFPEHSVPDSPSAANALLDSALPSGTSATSPPSAKQAKRSVPNSDGADENPAKKAKVSAV